MAIPAQPATRPANPRFSSGPCAKRPGWTVDILKDAYLGRSHRASQGKARLKRVVDKTKELLGVPSDYRCGIVPASDTGAFEMAMSLEMDLDELASMSLDMQQTTTVAASTYTAVEQLGAP